MKYFTPDLLEKLTFSDTDRILWKTRYEAYKAEFGRASSRLPTNFVDYYLKYGFHDDILESFYFLKNRALPRKKRVELDLVTEFSNKDFQYSICYFDVVKFESNIGELSDYSEMGDYLNGEILIVDSNYLSHEFTFYNCNNSIYIQFRELEFHLERK